MSCSSEYVRGGKGLQVKEMIFVIAGVAIKNVFGGCLCLDCCTKRSKKDALSIT